MHTPGPWTYQDNDEEVIAPHVCYTGDIGGIANPDDARLIAAAPDLLAALKYICSFYQNPMPAGCSGEQMINAARTAIAKAEGDSKG